MRCLRAACAVLITLGGLVIAGLFLNLAGWFCKICNRKRYTWLAFIPHMWGRFSYAVAYRMLLKTRSQVFNGNIEPLKTNDVLIVISNHPSTLEIVPWLNAMYTICPTRILALGKKELTSNPFVGSALAAIDGIIYIDRTSAQETEKKIQEQLAVSCSYEEPITIIIFPDSKRASPARMLEDVRKFKDKIPRLSAWLFHTTVPRAGALTALLNAASKLEGKRIRVIDITSGFDVVNFDHFDVCAIIGATYYCLVSEIRTPPTNPAEIREWLNDRFKDKNLFLELWRK